MPRVEGTQLVGGRFYPAITIEVEVGGKRGRGLAILDSGADFTMLPAEYVETLGIAFTSLALRAGKSIGAGGSKPRHCKGTLSYSGVQFADGFTVAEPGTLPFGILGREDFFKHFVVRFNWHRNPPDVNIDPAEAPKASKGKRRK